MQEALQMVATHTMMLMVFLRALMMLQILPITFLSKQPMDPMFVLTITQQEALSLELTLRKR